MSEMSDDEFLSYASSMADTPRCGFVPVHLARLNDLAGHADVAELWRAEPNYVVDADRFWIRDLVGQARQRLAINASTAM